MITYVDIDILNGYLGLISTITSVNDWYEKVFDANVVQKWKKEIQEQFKNDNKSKINSLFSLSIRILQSTAQGSVLDPECDWKDNYMCKDCIESYKNMILEIRNYMNTMDRKN